MSNAVWDQLALVTATPSSSIYISKFRGNVVPGNFILWYEDSASCAVLRENLQEGVFVARIIKTIPNNNNKLLVNLFLPPTELQTHLQTAIGQIRSPSTENVHELVQTDVKFEKNIRDCHRFCYVFHNDVVGSDESNIYIKGMADCYVVRYCYSTINQT